MSQSELKTALLIDADNAPASKIGTILSELAKYGVTNIRRAYGNWTNPTLKPWEECLQKYAIRPIQQFDYTKGKNATDAAMIIDAMDLLYTQQLDAFAIVSSDCDFTPLVMRILDNGLKVYGFGEEKTPISFIKACSTFLRLNAVNQTVNFEDSSKVSEKHQTNQEPKQDVKKVSESKKKTGQELKQDTKLMNSLRDALSNTIDNDGWSHLGEVGSYIAKKGMLKWKNYGYAKLVSLFKAIDSFEIQQRNQVVYVRNKQKKTPL
ncbi:MULTISPECIES: NYN domain-containing protein [unclassified Leptolyngbya]|uniref:NYN domain-containing protein n=1 Tax=unclassified Leptolyngbya TaxID=2650499 RepID=UPI001685EFA4|nr:MULTISPECIES: NYN domain-containing protein [unclassified Leptolyngbya]MBD1911360.1 NYN domain-containing protein [Leptolyngbya sp. FACHB-8]MBD2156622.1 NYN domain-containing protein [Leptolyngbya sp. FACHB-16]